MIRGLTCHNQSAHVKNASGSLSRSISGLFTQNILAQGWEVVFPDSIIWNQLSGWSQATDVKSTPEGGFIVVGETDLPTGAIRHYIRAVKTDGLGAVEWSKIYNFEDIMYDKAVSVEVADDSYFIAGSRSNDYYLMKIDLAGDTIWTKNYGTGWQEHFRGSTLTDDDHLVIDGVKSGIDDSMHSFFNEI